MAMLYALTFWMSYRRESANYSKWKKKQQEEIGNILSKLNKKKNKLRNCPHFQTTSYHCVSGETVYPEANMASP